MQPPIPKYVLHCMYMCRHVYESIPCDCCTAYIMYNYVVPCIDVYDVYYPYNDISYFRSGLCVEVIRGEF